MVRGTVRRWTAHFQLAGLPCRGFGSAGLALVALGAWSYVGLRAERLVLGHCGVQDDRLANGNGGVVADALGKAVAKAPERGLTHSNTRLNHGQLPKDGQ